MVAPGVTTQGALLHSGPAWPKALSSLRAQCGAWPGHLLSGWNSGLHLPYQIPGPSLTTHMGLSSVLPGRTDSELSSLNLELQAWEGSRWPRARWTGLLEGSHLL